jgi:hypothetical protein
MSTPAQIRKSLAYKPGCLAQFESYRADVLAFAEFMDAYRKRTGRMHPFLPLEERHEIAP